MNERDTWALEREIVLSRVFDAPRRLVFEAWTKSEHISQWFGPAGFTTTTSRMEVKVGGRWVFEMRAPDGTIYSNRVVYLDIQAPERLIYDHSSDQDDDPNRFRVTVTFEEQSDKKTVVTMRQLHPSKARHDFVIGFGAVELGYQTLDKLSAHLRK
ncbi:MAG: SRPBCC family protein [Myxococcota bacterium]